MNYRRFALWLCFFCFWFYTAGAQQQYDFRLQSGVKIVIDSDTIKNPWAGGLNSPVFSKIELNNDGQEDLFVFDRTQDKIYTFLAKSINGQWFWQYEPLYEYIFPGDISGWALLRDYNNDGQKDIFTKTSAGIKVYRNATGLDGKVQFVQATDFIRYDGTINLQVSSENLPAILDMDNDGDLDILTFDFAGSTRIEYYANQRTEQNLPADNLKFIQVTDKWGQLTKCEHVCNGFVFNGSCRTKGTKHNDGAALLALDLDGDLDKDILIGNDACTDLNRIINRGNLTNVSMTAADLSTNFPENTTRASFSFFPAAYYEDVTFDTKKDLLVAPFVRANTTNQVNFQQSSWLYQNISLNEVPNFAFQMPDFLQKEMVDLGELSVPAFADLDADGDSDMLVSESKGTIWFFRNVGTRTKPVFKLESKDYLGFAATGFKDLKIQFADINSDGKSDLILTSRINTTTSIKYILNTAPAGQPFNFSINSVQTLPVSVSSGDIPAFYDLDGDKDLDLIIATNNQVNGTSGALHFYRNTGSFANPVFNRENDNWGNIPIEFTRANIYPIITDLNKDNNPELLLTDDSGEIRVYSNFIAHQDKSFTSVSDIFFYEPANTFLPGKLGKRLTLAAADLTGDQIPEIVAGSQGGGINYISQVMRGEVIIPDPLPNQENVILYPNPAQDFVNFVSNEPVSFTIINVAGQKIIKSDNVSISHLVNVQALALGLYIVQLKTENNSVSHHKLVVNRK